MIARYKGIDETVGVIHFKPGSLHSIQMKRKLFPGKYIWLAIDGLENIPYTLESLFTLWESEKE